MVDVVGTASAVLALVGTAETAVTTFRTFYRGVGVVETTISNFLREVQTLLSLIKAIKGMLDELPSTLQQDRELKVIWGPMEVSLRDCILALEDLTRLFQRLNQSTGSWARNAVTQIRFQFQKPEIADLRERITSLQRNFDTAMGAMSLWVALSKMLDFFNIFLVFLCLTGNSNRAKSRIRSITLWKSTIARSIRWLGEGKSE